MTRMTQDEQVAAQAKMQIQYNEMLNEIRDLGGVEATTDMLKMFPLEVLLKQGKIQAGPPRGPGKQWHRVTIVEQAMSGRMDDEVIIVVTLKEGEPYAFGPFKDAAEASPALVTLREVRLKNDPNVESIEIRAYYPAYMAR